MGIEGLKNAAKLCRDREVAWRACGDSGGSSAHPEHDCWCRAYEAMACAEIIEKALIDECYHEDVKKLLT